MKFIYADAMDFVDPNFDFANDRTAEGRIVQWDDEYPHEFLDRAPYDGILISRGVVGDVQHHGKYTLPQLMRFRREGASKDRKSVVMGKSVSMGEGSGVDVVIKK